MPERLNDTQKLTLMHSRKHKKIHAVLLDRDGVINEEVNLLHKKSQLKLLKNAGKAISILNQHKIKAIIITNQPVAARNLCTKKELKDFSLLPEECVFIGDSTVDIETGRRAGMRTMLIRTGYAGKDGKYS